MSRLGLEIHFGVHPTMWLLSRDARQNPIFAILRRIMSLLAHLNNVASGLHHRSAPQLQQQFSLSQTTALTALVFDTSLEKGTIDIRRAITPIDINWAEALAQRWRAAVSLYREGDVPLACTYMGACVSYDPYSSSNLGPCYVDLAYGKYGCYQSCTPYFETYGSLQYRF